MSSLSSSLRLVCQYLPTNDEGVGDRHLHVDDEGVGDRHSCVDDEGVRDRDQDTHMLTMKG